jgi:hypothetical protein
MAASVTPSEGESRRVLNELGNWVDDFHGSHKSDRPGPQAFLVGLKPSGVVDPHFHGENQYQLIVGGGGKLGKHELRNGVFHYTDAFTPYGPIVADPGGLSFFTLRQNAYVGHHKMPGSGHLMKKRAGRNLVASADPGPAVGPDVSALMDETDGPRAYRLRAAAGRRLPSPPAGVKLGSGYLIVLSGELELLGRTHPRLSNVHVRQGEPLPDAVAGPEGAVALLLTYPLRD